MEKRFDDKTLLRVSLIFGILGVGILIALSLLIPESGQLDYYNDEGKVSLKGEVVGIDARGNYTFMKVKYECTVDTMVFDSLETNGSEFSSGSKISIEGNIQDYKGRKSIVADRIGLIR